MESLPETNEGNKSNTSSNSAADEKYLAALLVERDKLFKLKATVPICCKLLDDEIHRLQTKLNFNNADLYNLASSESTQQRPLIAVKLSEKVYVPIDKYPDYNFVGRILGPRGLTLKRMEAESGCRIMIRGKGSMRDKAQEEIMMGRSGWEHLTEPLHVVIEAEMEQQEAQRAMETAKANLSKLLEPTSDQSDLEKMQQLRELAVIKCSEQLEQTSSYYKMSRKMDRPGQQQPYYPRQQQQNNRRNDYNTGGGYVPRMPQQVNSNTTNATPNTNTNYFMYGYQPEYYNSYV